jgi:hypothetical protein
MRDIKRYLVHESMKLYFFIFCLLFFSACSLYQPKENQVFVGPYKDSLIDNSSGLKFYLDTSMIYVWAFDKYGKLLWKTDPWKDNNLMEYRVKRPTIKYFKLINEKGTKNEEVIGIGYNNSQSGYLDKLTGKFTFEGQD